MAYDLIYYGGETGITQPAGSGLGGAAYLGSTGIWIESPSLIRHTGHGQISGIYWNKSLNQSVGVISHSINKKTSSPTEPLFFPRTSPFDFTGNRPPWFHPIGIVPTGAVPLGFSPTGVQVYFYISFFSGTLGATTIKASGNDLFITGTGGINDYVSGASGFARPTGYLMHSETFDLLPNYAYPSIAAKTGASYQYSINAGGIYPSMLLDNTLSINMEMTWSGACGDAMCCGDNPC